MYSWGDDTKVWKKPNSYDYGSARAGYLEELAKKSKLEGERTYLTSKSKKAPKLELVDPKGKEITTESTNPILVAVDGTGSMQTWPAEIFDRLPLLYQTLSKYRKDVELSFSVIGDAGSDNWPVQISNFGKELVLDDYLKALLPEGGGGPGVRESYELWGYYVSKHVLTPKAEKPFLILMGDEAFYNKVDPKQAKHYLGDGLQAQLDSIEMWKKLDERFNIYLLRKSYPGYDDKIKAQWAEAIGHQKIVPVTDPKRVVDVAMGLVARSWGYFSDFKTSLSARQEEPEIKKVMESIRAAPEAAIAELAEESKKEKDANPSVKKSIKLTGK
ncbi:MAG TPA: hypothetical protein VJ461_02100 [Candidatus Nanoarchaeia archaeon]|nr:hypothetical protein [Candidatus Nanoarchaeia archaeon]